MRYFMINHLKRAYRFISARAALRIVLQTLVSIILIAALVVLAQRSNMLESLQMLQPSALILGGVLQLIAFTINGRRWQILLENFGIHERLVTLTELYFIGMFFSIFLPTGTGGDAVRMYDVARRSGKPAQAVVATLQERVAGLGISLLIGLVATSYYLSLLPAQARIWIILIQACGAFGIILLLYPTLLFTVVRQVVRRYGERPAFIRFATHPFTQRIIGTIRPIVEAPALPAHKLAELLGIATTATLLGMASYYVIGQSLQIPINIMAYCLIVPLVWIIRMVPVSLNGLGLTEGSFVFLMGLFAVPEGKALALALAALGIQTCCALFGGLLLAIRVARGTWTSPHQVAQPTAGRRCEYR
jgi:glycosyltransferase 2 family protein